ncbi:hypothetical protein FDB55_13245 [Clostridium botulinum]|nr:hypothetical protein [Clostridium botulinum]NFN14848.1 hypothetical protein [Clostridium botulinum]NFN22699.1 hypothetical protein [Clostridium botulinum]NFN43373.1 hypothetical protein [Clostridium botulinum]
MPLHNVIPLCNFKYVRDIHSCATFLYDTTGQIFKDESIKPAEVETVIEIEKVKTKLMYGSIREIDKSLIKRSLVTQTTEINIKHSREFYREMPEIEKLVEKELEPPQRELNKNQVFELDPELREINITTLKEVQRCDLSKMNYTQNLKILQMRDVSGITKVTNLNVEIDRTFKGDIDKAQDKNLGADAPIAMNKGESMGLFKDSDIQLYKNKYDLFMDYIQTKELDKIEGHYINRINESEIIQDHSTKLVDRLGEGEMDKDSQRYITDEAIVDINFDHSIRFMHNVVIISIDKDKSMNDLYRIAEKEMDKDNSKRLFYRSMTRDIDRVKVDYYMEPITIIPMFKDKSVNYFDRLYTTHIFKLYEHYLDRLHTTDIFKIQEKYADRSYFKDIFKIDSKGLNDVAITPIYKEFQKPILNLAIDDIYKEQSRSLNGTLVKEIYLPRDPKYIEVTKRWWWLHETSPNDRLILPNKDYGKMRDLLSNENYEYLRYSKHPIDWGKTWGKDANIPPAAISIEIMVDITNIITMIWHKSSQSWLSVSGKEGIQLLMELLYDWYSMPTSKPNRSYYRAYRWVRWEAEKVYFLNTTSGLQAIGILVKNLRDYLKSHHFNKVPIWRNPKAMDEERNFNRLAQNGDLMVNLNKNKGKRHYYIETQNFEKENKLIQAKT